MWLIHTTGLILREFHGDIIPPYAILSHCWDEDPSNEVSFQDFRKSRGVGSPGMKKISDFCSIAATEHGLKWAWADTCCIDKKSSAHLSEAINSMYRYYAKAKVCLVFMNDVDSTEEDNTAWQKSKWWTRGWTLQELLAPSTAYFYDLDWKCIGTKEGFADDISTLTGISVFMVLGTGEEPHLFTAGRRLSWAAQRMTTRPEDRAYSLLGLLNIHMPLLYGEREQAFIRLQQEILATSSDESILAWDCKDSIFFRNIVFESFLKDNGWQPGSVLATTPDHFKQNPESLVVRESGTFATRRLRPPSVTSWGIELSTLAKELHPTYRFFGAIDKARGVRPAHARVEPLLLIPLVVSDDSVSYALSCVLVLAPLAMTGRYGRLCCISERFTSLKDAKFHQSFFELNDEAKEVTLYLKT